MLYIMLFCAFPFERPADAKLSARAQALANAQRILTADYQLPASPSVSLACSDLLSRILTVDPMQRITVAAIQHHPWFRQVRFTLSLAWADLLCQVCRNELE